MRTAATAATAVYIDLNPVRAKIVGNPKNYRRCACGEAAAGDKAEREGWRGARPAKRAGSRMTIDGGGRNP